MLSGKFKGVGRRTVAPIAAVDFEAVVVTPPPPPAFIDSPWLAPLLSSCRSQ